MRYKIWEKDDFFVIGGDRVEMDPSVVELPETAALSWMYNHDDPAGPYGTVHDIRLEGDEIVGDLRIFDPTWDNLFLEDLNCRLGGYYTNVEKIEIGGRHIVTKCELQRVSVIIRPPYGANPFPKEI